MTDKQYDNLISTLIEVRGEKECDDALTKLKANFRVMRVMEIPEDKAQAVIDKLLSEKQDKENINEVFDGVPVCECGKEGVKKGNFHLCTKCRKVL